MHATFVALMSVNSRLMSFISHLPTEAPLSTELLQIPFDEMKTALKAYSHCLPSHSDTDACDELIEDLDIHFSALLTSHLICLLPSSCIRQHGQLAQFPSSSSPWLSPVILFCRWFLVAELTVGFIIPLFTMLVARAVDASFVH